MSMSSESKLYNADIKQAFLNEFEENTKRTYERIFHITQQYENALQKDISEFNKDEIETVLYGFKASNRHTVESYARTISSYIRFCVNNGLADQNILGDFRVDDFDKYVVEEKYLTEKTLRRLEDQCTNFQDAVILRLLFVGVGGKSLSEIRNLKKDDILGNKLRLVNVLSTDKNSKLPKKFTERYIDIDERTLYLLEGAMKETKYYKRNGEIVQTPLGNIRPFTDLIENDYVIRASVTNTDTSNAPVDKFVIYRRISFLSEMFGIEQLKAKYIQRSGMIYYAKRLIEKYNDGSLILTGDDIKIIADRFNVKSYHNLKSFLKPENVLKTYPELKDMAEGKK